MSNISQFSSREDIHEQACLWISRIDRGLNVEEVQALKVWVAAHPHHQKALFENARVWDDLSVLNELSGLFPLRASSTQDVSRLRKLATQARWSIAAGFMLMALAAGMMIDWSWVNPAPADTVVWEQQVKTAIGEQKSITLADGSVVHLNTNSAIDVAFSNGYRKVSLLRGEAHFTVAHDTARPFTVTAGENSVTAVGTAFNMQYLADQAFELVVTEGRVLVKKSETTVTESSAGSLISKKPIAEEGLLIFAGEKATVEGLVREKHNVTGNDIEQDLAWQQGMIIFKGEPLEQVLKEIGRYTLIRFELQDEALKRRRVAGYFKVGDIDGLLFALKTSFDIEHEKISSERIGLKNAG